ncbi:uclacyanin-3 [Jatropha curcas]|uniref:uclacyanin-3 n=1 Tax=Jatropha curcas TaxID=180498 RepID=UPI0005FB2F02|nr:uclacyanin-3 [Jatropha curcas]
MATFSSKFSIAFLLLILSVVVMIPQGNTQEMCHSIVPDAGDTCDEATCEKNCTGSQPKGSGTCIQTSATQYACFCTYVCSDGKGPSAAPTASQTKSPPAPAPKKANSTASPTKSPAVAPAPRKTMLAPPAKSPSASQSPDSDSQSPDSDSQSPDSDSQSPDSATPASSPTETTPVSGPAPDSDTTTMSPTSSPPNPMGPSSSPPSVDATSTSASDDAPAPGPDAEASAALNNNGVTSAVVGVACVWSFFLF